MLENFISKLFIAVAIAVAYIIAYGAYKYIENRKKKYLHEIDGLSYYLLAKYEEQIVIGTKDELTQEQLEKLIDAYKSDGRLISFRQGITLLNASEYAYYTNNELLLSKTRKHAR